MADRSDLEFTYSLIDKIFRLSLGEMADFSGAKYDGDFSLTLEQAQRRKHEYVAAQIGIDPGKRVLDLGCGWGPLLNFIRSREATGIEIPCGYSVFGEDAFRTSTGVHAAAIRKARRKGADELADRIYSGVPAAMVGLGQRVEVGFMSGRSNVLFALEAKGIEADDELVDRILDKAKASSQVLTPAEIDELVEAHRGATPAD